METKLGIWSMYYFELEAEEVVERFIKNGIFACELADEHGQLLLERSDDVIATGKAFKKFIDERNFEISQGHLWLRVKLCGDTDAVEKLFKWIDMYEAIGIKNMVLHCDNMLETDISRQEKIEMNVEKLKLIAEHIKDKEVTICLENLRQSNRNCEIVDRSAEDLIYIIDRVGSPKFGICLDTGHLNLTDKNHREFILRAGNKLKALHIADNEGFTDQHMMPFTRGTVDFTEVVKALREIGYKGLFNFEIPGENRIPIELRDAKIQYIRSIYEYLMRQ